MLPIWPVRWDQSRRLGRRNGTQSGYEWSSREIARQVEHIPPAAVFVVDERAVGVSVPDGGRGTPLPNELNRGSRQRTHHPEGVGRHLRLMSADGHRVVPVLDPT